jgi:hypothetical protein
MRAAFDLLEDFRSIVAVAPVASSVAYAGREARASPGAFVE